MGIVLILLLNILEYPAHISTSSLTSPMKMAIKFFNKTSEIIDLLFDLSIGGIIKNEKTPLHWIFLLVTDTIVWNVSHTKVFQRLLRVDFVVLLPSLFRNFLFAERIMKSMNRTPLSIPSVPATHNHLMWQAWDLAVEQTLLQLKSYPDRTKSIKQNGTHNIGTSTTATIITATKATRIVKRVQGTIIMVNNSIGKAFELLLENSPSNKRQLQLAIVLQVVLNQEHRLEALRLWSKHTDQGRYAVHCVLSVGIFPDFRKLSKSKTDSPKLELREYLSFIWAKILSNYLFFFKEWIIILIIQTMIQHLYLLKLQIFE